MGEVRVPGCQRQALLPGYRCYPEVVIRDWPPHLGEFGPQTGVDLARLLREPDWRWPLFDHETSFPHYAWSKLATATYEARRLGKIAPGNLTKEGPTR